MSNSVIAIVVVSAGITALGSGLLGAYKLGASNATAELEAQGLTTYIEVMEAIRNENVDLSSDAAVTAELCRLAGFEPDAPECSGL